MRAGRADEGIAPLPRGRWSASRRTREALLYLAGALASSGRPAEAVPFFERALAAGPRSTMALNGLGPHAAAARRPAGAADAFRESLRLDPDQPEIAEALRSGQP